MNNPIVEFAIDIMEGVGGMEDYERYELTTPNYSDRVTTAIWTIKCLANPNLKSSREILDLIEKRRAELLKEQDNES